MNEQDKTKEELIKELHELKNSLSLLDTIFESVHNGILVVSHQGTIIKTNTKFAEMWHIPSDILISADSKILQDYIRGQLIDPNGFIARVSELYGKPEAESLDEIPLKDGRVFKRILKPMYLVGKPIGKIWSFLDITERKRDETALQESEALYRIFINSTKDMVFLKDDKLNYLLVNEAMVTFFGTEERKIIGKSDFDLMPEKAAQKCLISDEQALNSGSVVVGDEQVGDKIFNTQKFKVPLSNGRYGIGGYIRDVTERRETEQKLINQAEEMKELNATKDKFFSIISHDLRSPFQIFLGFTRMMAEELPTLTLDEIQKIAVSMRSSANNLFNLLENLLQWSQMQRGLSSFKPEPFILSNGIVAIIELVRDAADKKKIALNYDVPEGLTVLADAQMFESLMHNLIFNAVKFTPKGGKISIVAKPMPDNSVEISIKDTGIGMNKNMVENLFRLDMQTNRKGTEGEPSAGLGLIICKDFVEKHGGKIWVESEEGKGTTFYFTL